MNNQLSVLVPFFSTNTSETSEEDDIFYEDKGTLEEILLLGPKVPIAPLISKEKDHIPKICIELVHLHATRDHLVLLDPMLLNIQESEELALRESVEETISHFLGSDGEFSSKRWIFPANNFEDLKTHTPSQANGLNIDIWMPKDVLFPGLAKQWRKLQNEIQMIWHDHPINEARLHRGELSINSVWIYGQGTTADINQHSMLKSVNRIFSNHYLGNTLDHRIQSLSDFEPLIENENHDFVFAQDLSSFEWEQHWNSWTQDLMNENFVKIRLLKVSGKDIYEHNLTSQSFKSNFFTKLFQSKKNHSKIPSWQDYSKNIHWNHIGSVECN